MNDVRKRWRRCRQASSYNQFARNIMQAPAWKHGAHPTGVPHESTDP